MWSSTYFPATYSGAYWPLVSPHTILPAVATGNTVGCDESLRKQPVSATVEFPPVGATRPTLTRAAGEFWSDIYGGRDTVRTYLAALEEVWKCVPDTISAAERLLSLETAPALIRDDWREITWLKSECRLCDKATLKFNQGAVFNSDSIGYRYDIPVQSQLYAFDIPKDWKRVPLLADRIASPTRMLFAGIDYWMDTENSWLVFLTDPFEDVRLTQEPVFQDGEVVDTQIRLWAHAPQLDLNWLYDQYGYVLHFRSPSTENYRRALKAVWDGVTGGTSWGVIRRFLSAVFDIPLVIEPEETVEAIETDNHGLFIATDKNIYRFPATATPTVSVGDKVFQHDSLISQLQMADFGRGELPSWLTALALDRGLLSKEFVGEVTFVNADLPLKVEENVLGYTKVSADLGGFPLDVQLFWDLTHERGIAAGRTLAQALDVRPTPTTEPTAVNLPATINPLKLLVENFLRNNAAAVMVDFDGVGPAHLDFSQLRHMQRLIPPHVFLVLVIVAADQSASQILGDGSPFDLASFDAADPLSDTYTFDDSTQFTAWSISGTCQ